MTADDTPGYKCPPEEHRFKPGQSGNRRGRPKGRRNLGNDLADLLDGNVTIDEGGKKRRISLQKALLKNLVDKALREKDEVKAGRIILDLARRVLPSDQAEPEQTLSETDRRVVEDLLRSINPQPEGEKS
jgi:Family of unknown function (DUF5681)